MIADTLLIPFILLLVCGMKFSNSGNNYFFDDYLSPQNTKVLKGIFAVAVVIYHLGMITNNAGITSAENIILTPLFLLSLMALLTKIQPGCKKFWSFIGEISYELYLVHGLMYLLLHSSVINVKSQVVFVFGVMALSIVAAIIIHYIDFVILKIYFFVYNLFHKTDKKRS